MRQVDAIIWDEVSAQHRHAIEAVERTLRDLRGDERPFGSVTVVLGGHFSQTLPVVPRGSKEDILNATFRHSTLWNDDLTVFFLSKNMRLDCSDTSAESFAKWLLDVGNGNNLLPDNKVQLLDGMQVPDLNSLINSTYPGIDSDEPPSADYFTDRMILAPRNADVSQINQLLLDRMAGDAVQYVAADALLHEAGADPDDHQDVPPEVIRQNEPSSLPPGELNLKTGCPVILLRNLSPSQGLCNGTRLVITKMSSRILEANVIGSDLAHTTAVL